jgi:hypothetical protein
MGDALSGALHAVRFLLISGRSTNLFGLGLRWGLL